ncbi:hypothetical protein HYV82_05825 [Candidatus Woesearchaeota archaeon]|nr:hypothetical protein [Candidatus Woesearchaeota archaeon]
MAQITVSKEQFSKILSDVETLIEDVTVIVEQDAIAKKRLAEVKANPLIGKSENELNDYLKKRGVQVE